MPFEFAAGSIPGRRHVGQGRLLTGRNNQDAYAWHVGRDWAAATANNW